MSDAPSEGALEGLSIVLGMDASDFEDTLNDSLKSLDKITSEIASLGDQINTTVSGALKELQASTNASFSQLQSSVSTAMDDIKHSTEVLGDSFTDINEPGMNAVDELSDTMQLLRDELTDPLTIDVDQPIEELKRLRHSAAHTTKLWEKMRAELDNPLKATFEEVVRPASEAERSAKSSMDSAKSAVNAAASEMSTALIRVQTTFDNTVKALGGPVVLNIEGPLGTMILFRNEITKVAEEWEYTWRKIKEMPLIEGPVTKLLEGPIAPPTVGSPVRGNLGGPSLSGGMVDDIIDVDWYPAEKGLNTIKEKAAEAKTEVSAIGTIATMVMPTVEQSTASAAEEFAAAKEAAATLSEEIKNTSKSGGMLGGMKSIIGKITQSVGGLAAGFDIASGLIGSLAFGYILEFSKAVYAAVIQWTGLNDAIEKGIELTKEIAEEQRHYNKIRDEEIGAIKDPVEQYKALQEELALSRKNVEGLEGNLKGTEKALSQMGSVGNRALAYISLGFAGVGSKTIQTFKEDLKDTELGLEAAKDRAKELQDDVRRFRLKNPDIDKLMALEENPPTLMERGKKLIEEFNKPLTEFASRKDELGEMFEKGALTAEVFNAEMEKLEREFSKYPQVTKMLKDAKKETEEQNKAMEEGKKIIEASLTPIEKFAKEREKLLDLQSKGALGDDSDAVINSSLKGSSKSIINESLQDISSDLSPLEKYQETVRRLAEVSKIEGINQEEVAKATAKARAEMEKHSQSLLDKGLTPLEKYKKELTELRDLFNAGFLKEEEFTKLAKGLEEDLIKVKKEAKVKIDFVETGLSSIQKDFLKSQALMVAEAKETTKEVDDMNKAKAEVMAGNKPAVTGPSVAGGGPLYNPMKLDASGKPAMAGAYQGHMNGANSVQMQQGSNLQNPQTKASTTKEKDVTQEKVLSVLTDIHAELENILIATKNNTVDLTVEEVSYQS